MENPKLFIPGDIVRVMRTKAVGNLEKSGEYTLAIILGETTPLPNGTRVYKIETSERETQRTVTYLEFASDDEKTLWNNNSRSQRRKVFNLEQ